jgi:hypothetical protein
MPRAAFLSALLHFLIALILLTQTHFKKNRPFAPATRHVIVDFVKIGPKSAAPMLGPQSISKNEKTADKNVAIGAAPTTKDASSTKPTKTPSKAPPKAPVPQKATSASSLTTPPHTEKSAPKKTNSAKTPVAKKTVAPTQAKSPPKAAKDAKDAKKPSTASKNASPATPKKSQARTSSQAGVNKAKIDLAKKGHVAQSVSDFLGKSGAGRTKNSALADTVGNTLTGTDVDRLNQHMKNFWNMPSGHEKASQIVVEIRLSIKPDGTVHKATIMDMERFQRDADFRIAAECALRAVLDPECSPLPLPPNEYELWKDMIFEFNPSEMCQ